MNGNHLRITGTALALALSTALSASETGGLHTLRGVHPAAAEDVAPEIYQHLDQEPVPRNYAQQPPLIPHRTRDYKINLRSNKCLTCHHPQRASAVNAPPVPASHFLDRDGVKQPQVSARRYFCVQCHVPQDGVRSPVANTFVPARAAPGGSPP